VLAPDPPPGRGPTRRDVDEEPPPIRADRPSRGLVVWGLITGLVFAAPLAYVAIHNLGPDSVLTEVLFTRRTLDPLRRTLVLAASVSASAAVVGTAAAWVTIRTDVPLRRFWRLVAPLPLVFPSFVAAAGFVSGFGANGLVTDLLRPLGVDRIEPPRGFWGAWFVLTLFTYPYVYLPVAARLASLPPSLEESARLLGRRPRSVFRTVVLPQTSPAIWAGTLLVFLYTVSEFGAIVVLRYDTLTSSIYSNRLFNAPVSMALSLVLGLIALAVVVVERSHARRRVQVEVARARRPLQVRLGRWRWPALLGIAGLMTMSLLAPLAVLTEWLVRGMGADGRGRLDVEPVALGTLVANTAGVSLVTALVAVAAVLPVAYLTSRYRSRSGGVVNAFVVAGFAFPGLVVALSLVSWSLSNDAGAALYQTFPFLVFGYVVHFGAQSMRASQVAVGSIPRRLEDAARMLGADRLRRLRTIELPLMLPGLGAAAGLVLLSTMKELPLTLILAPPGFETLATRVWSLYQESFVAGAGLAALLLVAVSAVLTWFLVLRRADALDR
jgi:iron(III) transport system permease protein